MSGFQILAFAFLGTILARELSRIALGKSRAAGGAIRLAITVAAIVCIARPNLTTTLAQILGIRRGTDLVLYIFCLAFLATSLYFYARQTRLQAQLADVVRHMAIREARFPLAQPPASSGEDGADAGRHTS
jgi:hypothetical protein